MNYNDSGTVSKILWHFTGGPDWDIENNIQFEIPKESIKAFDILLAIISSKVLKVGKYNEIVTTKIDINSFNQNTREWSFHPNTLRITPFNPVCCLADIPLHDLHYHSKRYGRFAIGFYREKIIEQFQPVFYSLNNSPLVIMQLYRLITKIRNTRHDPYDKVNYFNLIRGNITILENKLNEMGSKGLELLEFIDSIKSSNCVIESNFNEIEDSINNFGSFIKSFDEKQFESIFCEREWRSISDFYFLEDNIAMIIVPKEDGFYDNLNIKFDELIETNKYSKRIPIIPWEDL